MEYFGGTNVTIDKLSAALNGSINIDGTRYTISDWLKELDTFSKLIPGVSKIWIPYGSVEAFGILKSIEWSKFNFKGLGISTNENRDWWIYEPHLVVTLNGDEYFVYEYSIYKENLITERNKKLSKI